MAGGADEAFRLGQFRRLLQEALDDRAGLDIVAIVAAGARGVDGLGGKHDIGRDDVRLVITVRRRGTMARCAADTVRRMRGGQALLFQVRMTDEAGTVVGSFFR